MGSLKSLCHMISPYHDCLVMGKIGKNQNPNMESSSCHFLLLLMIKLMVECKNGKSGTVRLCEMEGNLGSLGMSRRMRLRLVYFQAILGGEVWDAKNGLNMIDDLT